MNELMGSLVVGALFLFGVRWYVRSIVQTEIKAKWNEAMGQGNADLQQLKQRRAHALLAAQQAEAQWAEVMARAQGTPVNGE